jgi:hypothetical protein
LPHATGYARECLIEGLAHSEGTTGVVALEGLYSTSRGGDRTAALHSLAVRTGPACTQRCVEALRSTSFDLQLVAAMLLADIGGEQALPDVLEWLKRRLGKKGRSDRAETGYTVPAAIRFAARHCVHAQLAEVLADQWASLDRTEQAWLRRTWPGLFAFDGRPVATADMPPPTHLEGSINEDEVGPLPRIDEPPPPEWWEEFNWAYSRATRRAQRAAKG